MRKTILFMFMAFFLASLFIAIPQGVAQAQYPVCTDAAGGVIPRPPTAEIPCGQAGGPACPPPPTEDNNGGFKAEAANDEDDGYMKKAKRSEAK